MTKKQTFKRETFETQIMGTINLNGSGNTEIDSGVGFLDHMLELLGFHSGFDLEIKAVGDLEVCSHHTIEDIALALGEAFLKAVDNKKGIKRYGTCFLPMDETLTRTVLDISGRPYHVFKADFSAPMVGELPTGMVSHFFYSFSMASKITLHQEILYGSNDHHKIESLFKGIGKALAEAVGESEYDKILSSKGIL